MPRPARPARCHRPKAPHLGQIVPTSSNAPRPRGDITRTRTSKAWLRPALGICCLLGTLTAQAAPGSDAGRGKEPREGNGATPGEPSRTANQELSWRWRRVEPWEYPFTVGLMGTALYLRFVGSHPKADWTGGILLDEPIYDAVEIDNRSNRLMVGTFTDALLYGSLAYRALESALVPSLLHGAPDVSWQMLVIDAESIAVVSAVIWGSQAIVGRRRPYLRRCDEPAFAAHTPACARRTAEANRSLIAGHLAIGLTMAGLTCTHHAHLEIYGGQGGDLACGLSVGAAALNGMGRLVTGNHYDSDVALGAALGVFGGWILPRLLHYGFDGKSAEPPSEDRRGDGASVSAAVMPSIGRGRGGLSLIGQF